MVPVKKAAKKVPAKKSTKKSSSGDTASNVVDEQLAKYRSMRDFHVTAEPSGKSSAKSKDKMAGLPFCIQKHAASHLHYDFRLGWNGVLKSWAIAKGPSYVTADKRYYLPKETIHADLQSDYFFGKPVANSKVKVVASTFDVAFKEFQTWEGKTDANGHLKFDIKLPDYFVGQPLQKGNAMVRLEVKLTDTADHTETVSRSYVVAEQAIQVIENRELSIRGPQ